ncbi:MAG: hypothetical protein AAF417_23455, partial [Pseudomonadota bacterium]
MATIFEESFETDGLGTRYTLSNAEFHTATSTINDDFFGRTNGATLASVAFTSSVTYAGPLGSFYFAANDTDEGAVTSHTRTIDFNTIDITGFTSLEFSGLFAEDDFTNGFEDWDTDTRVYVEVSIDGGAFSKVLQFAATGTNTAPRLDTDFDGVGDGTILTDTFQSFSANISGTGSTLDVRVVLENLNLNDEDIAFDNLQVTGTPPPANLVTSFVSGVDESIEGDVAAQIVVNYDTPPASLTSLRFTPNSSDIDIGSGPGVARILLVGAAGTTITATAVDDALVEGDETGIVSIELGGTLDPDFSLNPTDVSIRLVDSDANNPGEGAYALLSESFETDGNGSRYTTSITEFSDGFSDFFNRTDGSGISTAYEVAGEDGSFYFAAQDIDAANAAGSGGPSSATLNFNNIDITGYENLAFSALFAEDDAGIFQDIDSSDGLRIRAQIDGGGFFDILRFEAGGDQFDEVAQLDTNLNGIGDGAAITDAFTRYYAAIAGTGSSLDLEIEFQASVGEEDFSIDDIRVTGDAAPDFDVLTTGFVDIFEGGQSDTIIARVSGTPDGGDVV